METVLLVDRFGYHEILEEAREQWLEDILMYLGIDPSDLLEMEPSDVIDFYLQERIEILDYPSIGALKVLYDDELIGEWAGPEFELLTDEDTGEVYYKITIENWSIIEDEIEI